MRHGIKLGLFCLLALYFVGCDSKSSKKEARTERVSPLTPSAPSSPGTNLAKCPIPVSFHPKKGYLTNLFRATPYDHPEIKGSLGLKERLALLELCKEERRLIKQHSGG